MICDICGQNCDEEYTRLSLYVKGSEGIIICLECRIELTEHVKHLRSMINRNKKIMWKKHLTR